MLFGVAGALQAQVLTTQDDIGGVYEGTFRGGLQHGTGTYRLPNGYEYTGDWVDGEIKGSGIARFPNGSVYQGSFAKGKPEGKGHITFSDGGTYDGDWIDGTSAAGRRTPPAIVIPSSASAALNAAPK